MNLPATEYTPVEQSISPEDYEQFRTYLEQACGIILGDNKHYLVSSRLNRIMREFNFSSLGVLVQQVRKETNSRLHDRIVDAMTTNETLWFRDTYPFEIYRHQLLAELAQDKKRTQPVRIWSAASSSGQEAYSISMMTHEFALGNPGALRHQVEIIGTDISHTMLEEASQATYDNAAISRGISQERKGKYFVQKGLKWELRPELKKNVSFRELNLLQPYTTLGKFDIIFCRNVLIYFSTETKRDILSRMAKQLNPQGYLFLGASESIANYSTDFDMIRCNPGVIYRLKPDFR